MTLQGSEPLLRVPPFPGARISPIAIASTSANQPASETLVGRLIADIRQARVGGTFWESQPALPQSYVLVQHAPFEAAGPGEQVVEWNRTATDRRAPNARRILIRGPCDPWHMVAGATLVVAPADDELLLIASIAGVPVRAAGSGRYADLDAGRVGKAALPEVIRREVEHFAYRSPFTGEPTDPSNAVALLSFWRELVDSNRDISAAVGFATWKRGTVAPLLWSGTGKAPFVSHPAGDLTGSIAIWKSRASRTALQNLKARQSQVIEVEDGFIRSAGLGAECVPPLSIVVDRAGIYFDPERPSDLENIIQSGSFSDDMIVRARALRSLIVDRGVSKYAVGATLLERRGTNRRHILVPGQVEDDRSVLSGRGPATNLELLRRVRSQAPDACLIYKPHPDVEAGHRVGRIDEAVCLAIADEIVRDQPITSLIAMVDEVHVNTSLAGFEALLRGKRVVTYGVPFYAGWGLTDDRGPVPSRRSAVRSLDELVAAALLVYPRYVDPVSNLPCPPEVLISRLSEGGQAAGSPLVKLRRLQGAILRRLSRLRG